MAIIVPAILEATKEAFTERAGSFERLPNASRIQVDFCDGAFVPNTTVGIKDIDVLSPAFFWEAHLMVEEPVDFFEFQLAGFNMLIVHFESFRTSQQLESALKEIRVAGLKVGLAINPETPVTTLPAYAHLIDQITLLAIHPGFQGQQMLPDAQRRVAEVRRLLPRMDVEVDGGINTENATHIAAAGADFLVVGSALWEDPVRSFEDLQSSLGVASA